MIRKDLFNGKLYKKVALKKQFLNIEIRTHWRYWAVQDASFYDLLLKSQFWIGFDFIISLIFKCCF